MKKKKIAIAVLSVLGVAALYTFLKDASGETAAPNTAESAEYWMCRACSHSYKLTPRQMESAANSAGHQMPLNCPKCGKQEAWLARYCDKHQVVFLTEWAPGATGRCPKCNPTAKAPVALPGELRGDSKPVPGDLPPDAPEMRKRSKPNL